MDKNELVTRVLHLATQLQVREAEEGSSRTITGYAILFNTPSDVLYSYDDEEEREVIAPSAVTKELLDSCDIKMTMFHDRQLILARSNKGTGTLKYSVDDKGVAFEFEAPKTADGDKALELVRRGDIAGCSFMFTTHYYDEAFVTRTVQQADGKTVITYTINVITGIYDFTLAADPAYPATSVEAAEARELFTNKRKQANEHKKTIREQVKDMRQTASRKVYV